jgi:tetratricopeptide (TPR) repeat protein
MNRATDTPPLERLVDSSEFGPLLRDAGAVSIDEKRLQRNRAALLTRLAEETAGRTAGFPFPVVLRHRVAFVAFALLLLSSGGFAAVYYMNTGGSSPGDASDGIDTPAVHPDFANRAFGRPASPQGEPEPPADLPEALTADGRESSATDTSARSRGRRGADSTLDEQVRLFNKAKARLASGDPASALKILDRLKQRYPRGPLLIESEELTARVLSKLNRYREASRTVQVLIQKTPTRKKAQLYRFLGDLQVKQHRCDNAVQSYRRALGLGLSGAESDAARDGIRKCGPLK